MCIIAREPEFGSKYSHRYLTMTKTREHSQLASWALFLRRYPRRKPTSTKNRMPPRSPLTIALIGIFFLPILDWLTGDPDEVAEEEPDLKVVVGKFVRFGIDASVKNEGM